MGDDPFGIGSDAFGFGALSTTPAPSSSAGGGAGFMDQFGTTLNGALSRYIDVEMMRAVQGLQPSGTRIGSYSTPGGVQYSSAPAQQPTMIQQLIPLLLISGIGYVLMKD